MNKVQDMELNKYKTLLANKIDYLFKSWWSYLMNIEQEIHDLEACFFDGAMCGCTSDPIEKVEYIEIVFVLWLLWEASNKIFFQRTRSSADTLFRSVLFNANKCLQVHNLDVLLTATRGEYNGSLPIILFILY